MLLSASGERDTITPQHCGKPDVAKWNGLAVRLIDIDGSKNENILKFEEFGFKVFDPQS
jgi:hypothetical protein